MLASLLGFENKKRTKRVFIFVVIDTQVSAAGGLPALANVFQCTPSSEVCTVNLSANSTLENFQRSSPSVTVPPRSKAVHPVRGGTLMSVCHAVSTLPSSGSRDEP